MMKYRKGSEGAAIKRHSRLIISELETRKSQAQVRRFMIEQNLIGGISQSYFNLVLADLGIGKNAVRTSAPGAKPDREQMPVVHAPMTQQAQNSASAKEANASPNRFTEPFVDFRFSTNPEGGAK